MATLIQKRSHSPAVLLAKSLARLEQEIGGREALVAALSHAPKSRDLQYVLGMIGNPRSAEIPLADLCASGGITAGELIQAYTAGEIARAQAISTSKVGAKLADVASDTMRRALPEEQTCKTCQGTGSVTPDPTKADPNPMNGPCRACGASGRLVVEGDLEHKKLALEMGKLLHKGGGSGVNVQVNQAMGVQLGTAGGALEKLQIATDQILYGEDDAGSGGPSRRGAAHVLDAEVEEVLESTPEIDPSGPIEEGDWRSDQSGEQL